MLKKIIILFFCLIVTSNFPLLSQTDTVVISIEGFVKTAIEIDKNLYIMLVTKDIFKTPLAAKRMQIIPVEKKGSNDLIHFNFSNIEPGIYGIRCFIDMNSNQKLDGGIGGPVEPWGMSWQNGQPKGWPKFKNISFNAFEGMDKIMIEVK